MTSWTATASSSAANKIPDRAGGISSAAYTAGTEAAAAAVPTISPARTSTRPLRRLVTVPATLVGMLTSSAVPFAVRSLTAKPEIRSGTAMIPPPMPNRPEAVPTTRPRPA
jgi:hypothetical protein